MISPRQRAAARTRLAPLLLMPAGAFAVHQLRYWLAFGSHAGLLLERQGHSYLHSVVPWIVLLLAVAAGLFLRTLGRALSGEWTVPGYSLSFAGLWLACASTLLALYAGQELLEGLASAGHPAGLAGVLGYGGWWAIPSSACIGLVVCALLHGGRWLCHVAQRLAGGGIPQPHRRRVGARPPVDILLLRLAPLAGGWSGRAPPR
jgi:hypothetical protein